MTFYNWIQRRENGLAPRIGDEDFILKMIYKSFKPYNYWNNCNLEEFGAIFNLEFSPDG